MRLRTTGGLAFAGLISFLVVLYANPGNWLDELADVGFAKIAASLALTALAGSWLLYGRRLTIGGKSGLALAGLFALCGFSALWSWWPRYSMDTFLDGLKYLAIFLVAANVIDSRVRLRRFVSALAIVSVIPAFGAISSFYRGEHLVDGDRAGWIGIFGNPNDLAYHLVVGMTMALAAAAASKKKFERLFYFSLLAPMGFALELTKSRGGMIAAAVVLLLWLTRAFKRSSLVFRFWAVALTLGCVVMLGRPSSIFEKRTEESSYHGEDMSARGRVDAWRTGMEIAKARPLSGVGAGAFMIAWPDFAPGDAGPPRTEHNTFIQLVGELGFPALALFLIALATGLVGAARATKTKLEPWARGVQCGLVGFAVCSLWGGLAFTWPLYLLLGAAWGVQRIARREAAAAPVTARAVHWRPTLVGAA